jgi:hypothetical protein
MRGIAFERVQSSAPGCILAVLLCLASLLSLTGCGPDPLPDYFVRTPQVALDPQGNVLALYEVSEGRGAISYLQKITPDGTRLWGEEGVRLDTREPDYPGGANATAWWDSHNLIADEAGNVTAFWTYQGQIYAEKLDADGSPVWPAGRVVVATFGEPTAEAYTHWTVANNATGTTVVWLDENRALTARGLDDDGSVLWTAKPFHADALELTAWRDQAGNTWIMWVNLDTRGIYIQLIDTAGNAVWGEPRELRESQQRWNNTIPWLTQDGNGGVVVAWQDYFSGTGYSATEVRSVSVAGDVEMNPADDFFKVNPGATLPRPLLADADGLVALWATRDSLFAQRVDPEGNTTWGENGVVVGANVATFYTWYFNFQGSQQPGGTVVTWQTYISDYETVCRAQRIDTQGRLLWGGDGVAISTAVGESRWRWQWSATTADGAAILAGVRPEGDKRQSRLQKVGIDGGLSWGVDGIRLDDWKDYD